MDFREVHQQSLTEMKELQQFSSSTFDTLTRQKFIEDQNTIMELSGRLQELQNEVNCMNDSKEFQDAESVRNGNSHVTSRPVSFPPHPIPEGMLRHSFVSPRRDNFRGIFEKKEGDQEYFVANQFKKKCKEREFLGIHDLFIRDARFRKTMIELGRSEEIRREMDKLANEDHTHHATAEEISVYRNNVWIRSNFVGSELISKKHCLPCVASRIKRIRLLTKIGGKTLPHTKRSQKNDDKSAVAMLKKRNWQEKGLVTDDCHDRSGQFYKRSDQKLGQNSSKRQSSDTRKIGLRTSKHDAAEVYSPEEF